ncbi:alpha/beta fold hydrolase [Bdellovibrio sp. HCB337]|uniref:alpha/beta fold hydrolase n=1 Tax=Bdellovibrio sp. HCB337 TaxID=3394358 RepID=UPI0039A4F0A8
MQKNWILIRGLARGVGHWADFPERIQAAFPNDKFEYLEIPGNGSLYRENSPLTMNEMVESFRRQSKFVRSGEKVHILAISLGAMLATAWADRYPQEIEELVLINSSSAQHSKFYERLKPENYLKMALMIAGFKRRFTVEDMERKILMMTANSSERRDYALPIWTEESTAHPIQIQNFVRQLWAAGNYTFPTKPRVPTVLLNSANDHFVDASCSKALAEAWQCPMYVHPWAGHDLPLDDPDWVLSKLKNR